ncbi:Acyl-homoserine lactone acylase QuiP [subsurface metagenome]
MRKSLLIIPAIILLLILFLGTSWLFVTRRTFPQTRGTIELEGLSAPVEIYRDPDGVPHIYADTLEDLFLAQGFVHAQDRFWQMEFWRRIGSGRLAELFGKSLLGTDIYLRTVGFRRVAEREYTLYDDSIRRILDSYAAGVNTYILNRKPAQLGLEFTFLKLQGVEFEIEPWTPINTLTWLKIMAEDLGANMQKELYSIDLIRAVGVELIADYFPSYREGEMPFIVADREIKSLVGDKRKINGLASLSVEELSIILQLNTRLVGGFNPAQPLAFGKGGGIGSNSWVISGKLTATGYPLLAYDTHLAIQMPSIWYEIGLHSKKGAGIDGKEPLDVRGFSFPGTPAVVVGHNDRIAWGITNVGPDVQDLYIERINPKNPHQYEVNGEWVDMEILREEIIIQGEDKPYVLLVRNTRHGPVMTDHGGMTSRSSFDIIPEKDFPENLELKALSLRWTALQPNRTIKAILLLNQARNFEDFREALRYFDIPAQFLSSSLISLLKGTEQDIITLFNEIKGGNIIPPKIGGLLEQVVDRAQGARGFIERPIFIP